MNDRHTEGTNSCPMKMIFNYNNIFYSFSTMIQADACIGLENMPSIMYIPARWYSTMGKDKSTYEKVNAYIFLAITTSLCTRRPSTENGIAAYS